MTGTSPGDPHSLSKSWNGGSMYWAGWHTIKALQKMCYDHTPKGKIIIHVWLFNDCHPPFVHHGSTLYEDVPLKISKHVHSSLKRFGP